MKAFLLKMVALCASTTITMAPTWAATGTGTGSTNTTNSAKTGSSTGTSAGASTSAGTRNAGSSSSASKGSQTGVGSRSGNGSKLSENTPPPAPLVANLMNTKSQPQGSAVYMQTSDKTGKVTGSVLNVQVTPLPSSMVGSSLNVTVDSVVVGTAKITSGSGKNSAKAQLTLNSANKQKVPPVTPGSLFQVGPAKGPLLGQGTFMTPPSD